MPATEPMSPADYVHSALELVRQHALTRDNVDWPRVQQESQRRCARASTLPDTYPTIEWLLSELGDAHSFFSPPSRGSHAIASGTYSDEVRFPTGGLGEDSVATIDVPSFRGSQADVAAYAGGLRLLLAELLAAGAAGWVVDLTDNPGGNMIPMIGGLSPLLGQGRVGAFEALGGVLTDWVLDAMGGLSIGEERVLTGTKIHPLVPASSRVALMIGPRTASSGEAVAVAFGGRPNTLRFGLPTKGLVTSNETFDLVDGATLVVTTARFVDRTGRTYLDPIQPDVVVTSAGPALRQAAVSWVLGDDVNRSP